LLPERLLDLELNGSSARPRYLDARCRPWVQALLDRLDGCVGAPRDQVVQRLAARPRLGESSLTWRALIHLTLRLFGFETRACLTPRTLRRRLFERAAAQPDRPPGGVLEEVAASLELSTREVVRDLYADLPAEQRLVTPATPLSAGALTERFNLAQAQGLLLRAIHLTASAEEGAKALLRFARLQRLLCLLEPAPEGGVQLQLSGPLSLFRHTMRYGRAMAAWLPALVAAPRWRLEATCVIGGRPRRWRASHTDPIGTTHAPPRRFDSKLEERFFDDLSRVGRGWHALREADPVQVGSHIACPDFTLIHEARGARVPVELVGFWTPEYLRAKWETVRALPSDTRWLLCVDEALASGDLPPPAGAPVFLFRRRIDVQAFLDFVERLY
jgi:predicted nuclease of restriction endonuclease-like RecB superfamily